MSSSENTLTDFDHRIISLSDVRSSTIKQQPCSPLSSYQSLTNEFFPQHHYHRSTSSPDNEQISPLSNNLTETSSTSNVIPPSTAGRGL